MRRRTLARALVVALGLAAPPRPATAAHEWLDGTWSAERNGERVQIAVTGDVFGTWGTGFDLAALRGVDAADLATGSAAPVAFRVERQAGVFTMNGAFQAGRGAGRYRFVPDRAFAAMLRALNVPQDDPITERRLMSVAFFSSLSTERVRELTTLGLARLSVHRLIDMVVHGVTPEYVRELQGMGYPDLTADQVTRLRLRGVTPAFIRELRAAGHHHLPVEKLLTVTSPRD